jgi:hypothetical protein
MVENGGTAHIGAIVGALTLDAAGNGSLDLPTAIGVDNTLLLSGTGDLLAFDTPSAVTLSVAPAIVGFADGDVWRRLSRAPWRASPLCRTAPFRRRRH